VRRIIAALVLIVGLGWPSVAGADPIVFEPGAPLNIRLSTGATITTDGGSTVRVPAGAHVVGEPEWQSLDVEMRRLQDAETRLTAQNDSLRNTASPPSWWGVLGFGAGLIAGIVVGAWAL
jgi:hypothetical protein